MTAVVHRLDEIVPAQLELPFFASHTPIKPTSPPMAAKIAKKEMPQTYQLSLFDYQTLQHTKLISDLCRAKRLAQKFPNLYVLLYLHALSEQIAREVFIPEEVNRPVRFVPRTLHGFLDRHFPSFVVKRHELFDLSVKLADMGKTRVGDVVKVTHAEIEELVGGDQKKMRSLIEALDEVGLGLDMKTPGWKSPGGIFHARW